MSAGRSQETPGIAEAADLLTQIAGLRTIGERSDRTARQIALAMRRTGASGPDYRSLLERDAASFQDLIRHVTVSETHFFREAGHFELLVRQILPELRRDRPAGHRLQLWSAGCATGEEAYTLAIILEEHGLADRAELLATDISEEALRTARAARYRAWSLRGVDVERRQAYFRERGDRFALHDRFVERVTFRRLNLVADPYPAPPAGGFDVIFCRNVLIYLTPEAIDRVVARLTAALAPGGWLITAATDPHLTSVPGLQLAATDDAIGYRRVAASPPTPGGAPTRSGLPHAATEPSLRPPRRAQQPRAKTQTAATTPKDASPTRTARPHARAVDDPDAETEYRRAAGFLAEGHWEDAARAARSALYLDPELVVAQIVLGRAALHLGDVAGAARAWRNAQTLLERLDAQALVPLGGGASAGRLLAELAGLTVRSRGGP